MCVCVRGRCVQLKTCLVAMRLMPLADKKGATLLRFDWLSGLSAKDREHHEYTIYRFEEINVCDTCHRVSTEGGRCRSNVAVVWCFRA